MSPARCRHHDSSHIRLKSNRSTHSVYWCTGTHRTDLERVPGNRPAARKEQQQRTVALSWEQAYHTIPPREFSHVVKRHGSVELCELRDRRPHNQPRVQNGEARDQPRAGRPARTPTIARTRARTIRPAGSTARPVIVGIAEDVPAIVAGGHAINALLSRRQRRQQDQEQQKVKCSFHGSKLRGLPELLQWGSPDNPRLNVANPFINCPIEIKNAGQQASHPANVSENTTFEKRSRERRTPSPR